MSPSHIYIHICLDGWRSPFKRASAYGSSNARLCWTVPDYARYGNGMAAQRQADELLFPVGDLNTLPTLNLSQHRGSCYDASATLDSRTAEGAHTRIAIEGAWLRPGNSTLSITHKHL